MNRRTARHRLRVLVVTALVLGGLAGSGLYARQHLQPTTTISATPPPVVTQVLGAADDARTFTAGPVSIDLPKDWEQFTPPDAQAGSYSWRNTLGNKGVRTITVYVDTEPRRAVYNRILPVEGSGEQILVLGGVSGNCTNFAESGRVDSGSASNGEAAARWEDVQFTCDTAMYNRNIVGISSKAVSGAVRLTGPSGARQLAVVYNDADAAPQQAIFTAAVESIRLN